MRIEGQRESENIEDRRGIGGRGLAIGGGGGVITLIIIIVAVIMGKDPRPLLQNMPQGGAGGAAGTQTQQIDPAEEPYRKFVAVVLADTEDVWGDIFQKQLGRTYERPKLVLFSGQVDSACGMASAAVGPFYCPGDENVYLDLSFFRELKDKFPSPGDFAMAYVVAHEVGHHVQDLLGISDKVHQAQQRAGGGGAGAGGLSVRLELQADYLAGVWANHANKMRNILESGDVEEAITAAQAIGDDTLQKRARGRVMPDSFTHGTSAQRVRWFRKGLETGDVKQMNQLFELPAERL
jgi:predicted metalloprotease